MLKYEEKLHFDKYYSKMQSSSFLHKAISLLWGIIGYVLLYYLIEYIFTGIPDFQPWDNFKTWFKIENVKFTKSDLVYFVCGLIINCYGFIRLSKITIENHSAKNKENNTPNKLLITGYYAKVRHPMYGTFIILQAGFMLSLRSFIGMILALIIVIVQYINAGFEEKSQLIPIFGEEYHQYTKKVRHMLLTKFEIIVFILALLLSVVGYAF
jgi:protein-S-isoprenylcysteine O-methyltransferase Ste14